MRAIIFAITISTFCAEALSFLVSITSLPARQSLRLAPNVRANVKQPAAVSLSLIDVAAQNEISDLPCNFQNLSRRNLIYQLTFVGGALAPAFCAASDSDPDLKSRFGSGKIRRFDPAGPFGAAEAPLPEWLKGEWDVKFTYKGSGFPLGRSFAEFKQLLGGNMRSPAESAGAESSMVLRWGTNGKNVVEDKNFNTQNFYNAFSKATTIEGSKGPRTRNVAWMPILTQRGIYEKVNSVNWKGQNDFDMVVKEIAPDLSAIGATTMQGTVVNRLWEQGQDGTSITLSETFRIRRLSPGRAKLIETGTGDTEILTEFRREPSGAAVRGRQRALVYLVPFPGPEGALYAESQGAAVAVYDWDLEMTPRTPTG